MHVRMRLAALLAASCTTFAAGSQDISDLLARAGRYVVEYHEKLSLVVVEERYKQEEKRSGQGAVASAFDRGRAGQVRARRTLAADMLMVKLPDELFFGFRDVFEVNGRKVADREQRLRKLFLESPGSLRKLVEESARFNVGSVQRNYNVPTMALLFLDPGFRHRFVFEDLGADTVENAPVRRIQFVETERPTLIRLGARDDILSRGTFWIDASGRVLKTTLTVGDATSEVRGRVTVTYRPEPKLDGMLVPREMREYYDYPNDVSQPYVECTATYTQFRRFSVEVNEKVNIK